MVESQLAKDGLAELVVDRGDQLFRHNGLSLYHFLIMLLVFEGKIGGKAACNGVQHRLLV